MKVLKIEENMGQFMKKNSSYVSIEMISKEDLLYLMERILAENVELDPYEEGKIANQAHQVIYKSIYTNLKSLLDRKQEFIDESETLFLEDYKRYVESAAEQGSAIKSASQPK